MLNNRKYIFKGSIFHCYVRLPECTGIQNKPTVDSSSAPQISPACEQSPGLVHRDLSTDSCVAFIFVDEFFVQWYCWKKSCTIFEVGTLSSLFWGFYTASSDFGFLNHQQYVMVDVTCIHPPTWVTTKTLLLSMKYWLFNEEILISWLIK